MSQLLWTPPADRVASSNLKSFIDMVNRERGLSLQTYDDLYEWSIRAIPAFWESVWKFTDEDEPNYSVEASIEAEQALKAVEAALYELPTKCRQAFVMHRRNGMSYPDIAAELAVSVSMVEKYIIRALKHLRSVRRAGR